MPKKETVIVEKRCREGESQRKSVRDRASTENKHYRKKENMLKKQRHVLSGAMHVHVSYIFD